MLTQWLSLRPLFYAHARTSRVHSYLQHTHTHTHIHSNARLKQANSAVHATSGECAHIFLSSSLFLSPPPVSASPDSISTFSFIASRSVSFIALCRFFFFLFSGTDSLSFSLSLWTALTRWALYVSLPGRIDRTAPLYCLYRMLSICRSMLSFKTNGLPGGSSRLLYI